MLNDDTFVPTACYSKVLQDDNYIIMGRQGAGKTAFAMMIPKRESDNLRWQHIQRATTPDLFFTDLVADLDNHDVLRSISSPALFYQLWEHFILVSCMQIVLRKCAREPYTDGFSTIYNYLRSIKLGNPDVMSNVARVATVMLESLTPTLSLGDVQLKIGSADRIRDLFDQQHNYGAAVSALREALRSQGFRILFLIDNIDDNLADHSHHDLVFDFISQLLRVARDLNYGPTDTNLPTFGDHVTVKRSYQPTCIQGCRPVILPSSINTCTS